MTTIHITLESEPHTENLDGVMLNRPAPQGGAFLISQRLDRAIWNQLKAAGAWYVSADDLEEFDMFNAEPGWRYNLAALKALLANSYTLDIRGETVTTADQLNAMFTDEAKAAYQAKRQTEREVRQRAEAEEKAEAERVRAEKGAVYESWKANHLTGLVKTYAHPNVSLNWQKAVHFGSDTPGTWYTTGDSWSVAECNGKTVYQCYYGNAVCYYAPQSITDEWIRADLEGRRKKYGDSDAAKHVLEYYERYADCIGGDIAVRQVELYGVEFFVNLARQEPWFIEPMNGGVNARKEILDKYKIPFVELETYAPGGKYPSISIIHKLTHPTEKDSSGSAARAQTVYEDKDGNLYGKTYQWTLWRLNTEQISILNGVTS